MTAQWRAVALLAVLSGIQFYAVVGEGAVSAPVWRIYAIAAGLLAIASALPWFAWTAGPPLNRVLRVCLVLLPCYVAVQLAPLPPAILRVLSPLRAALTEAVRHAIPGPAFAPLTTNAAATAGHLSRVLVYIAVFLLVRKIASAVVPVWIVALPLVAGAAFEAALGILQYAADPAHNDAHGTYLNRNHFAGLLEMSLPFAVLLALVTTRGWIRWAGGAAGALMLAAIALSLSRTGFVLALLSLAAMAGLVLRRRPRVVLIGVAAIAAVGAAALAQGRLLSRFAQLTEYAGTDRRIIWTQTLRLIHDYPWFGCGLGAYRYTWLKYKTEMPLWATDYVHNDYLQLLAELGLIGCLILGAAMVVIFTGAMRAAWWNETANTRYLAIACSTALWAMALHSLDDFNLYIPANAMTLAWIAGLASTLSGTALNNPQKCRPATISQDV